jgi:hypothetical protein
VRKIFPIDEKVVLSAQGFNATLNLHLSDDNLNSLSEDLA